MVKNLELLLASAETTPRAEGTIDGQPVIGPADILSVDTHWFAAGRRGLAERISDPHKPPDWAYQVAVSYTWRPRLDRASPRITRSYFSPRSRRCGVDYLPKWARTDELAAVLRLAAVALRARAAVSPEQRQDSARAVEQAYLHRREEAIRGPWGAWFSEDPPAVGEDPPLPDGWSWVASASQRASDERRMLLVDWCSFGGPPPWA